MNYLNVMCTYEGEASWTRPGTDTEEHRGGSSSESGADDWVSSVDDETGQEYWYNSRTGESSWA